MLLHPGGAVFLHARANLRGGDLSQLVRQRDDLVPGVLDGARLVGGDVPTIRRDNAFPGAQAMGDDGGVGLRATDHEMHLGVRRLAGSADALSGRGTELVGAITGISPTRPRNGFEDAGVG